MISNKTYYGVSALTYLAVKNNSGHVGLGEIATNRKIPLRFLELIFSRLKSSGIVNSVRGAGGGYYLAKPPGQITLAELIFACEGMSEFAVSSALQARSDHDDPVGSVLIEIMKKQFAAFRENLNAVTLADVIRECGLSSEMYWI